MTKRIASEQTKYNIIVNPWSLGDRVIQNATITTFQSITSYFYLGIETLPGIIYTGTVQTLGCMNREHSEKVH